MNLLLTPFRYLFAAFWTVLMITSSIIIMVITFNRKIPVVMARTMFSPGISWAFGVKLVVNGKENLKDDESYIFASNHLSYLDIPVLFQSIPHNLYFIAKKEVKLIPFIGWYMYATGMIFIDRSNRAKAIASMDRAGQLIKRGKDVLMFPEGTRSRTGKMNQFKKGAFMLASKADIAIVPVSISGTEKVNPFGTYKIYPNTVTVNIGKPIRQGDGTVEEFIAAGQNAVLELQAN